jgi:hypothetical protein
MRNWENVTLGDLGRALARYRPFVGVVGAVLAIAILLPGRGTVQDVAAGPDTKGGPSVDATTDTTAPPDTTAGTDTTLAPAASTVTSGGAKTAGRTGAKTGSPASSVTVGAGGQVEITGEVGPDCDLSRGRIKVPSNYSPPCAPPYKGDNGGVTGPGVTADTVTVVYYLAKSNAAADAALRAAGASDERPAVIASVKQDFDFFAAHWERYGRKVDLKFFEGNADATDDAAGKADAIKIADLHPFAVINAANNAMVDTLASRKIVCICTTSQPQEFYDKYAPYAGYTTLMSSTQGYIHRAEYVGKRLAGRVAKWAGTRDALPMNTEQRKFGLLWYETTDHAYASGIEFFKRELRDKYNVTLAADVAYNGYPDVAATQEQARPAITKLKGAGINSLIFSGDPIAPAIFTQEATRQAWFPEWIVTGSALVDTTLFARTYDKTQWNRAFGVSFLTARFDNTLGDAYRLIKWHSGQTPAAVNTYPVIYAPIWILFTGMHMAGPDLTAHNFEQGLFNYPVTGHGMLTGQTVSYGKHGIWPFTDHTEYDDVTEIWWNPNATGTDEVGHQGTGMYAYVEGGKRYLPGEHPSTDPHVFDFSDASAVTFYTQLPAGDRPPEYPRDPSTDKQPTTKYP